MLYFCRKYYENMNLNSILSNKKKHKITIALDFDGTCVVHRYPSIGEDLPFCVKTLKKWIKKYNVGLILDTMRSDKELEDAIQWFKDKGIELYGVGKNPTQHKWTNSNKCHAMFSIDDRNVGAPIDENGSIDWKLLDDVFTPYLERVYKEMNE